MAELSEIKNLQDLIKGQIEGEILEQTVKRLVPPGENYGSIIYKVDFTVKNANSTNTYHAVAKCTPPNKVTQEVFNTQITFKTEIGWYTTVIPTLKEFQRAKGVGQVANFFQRFFGARISLDPESDVVDEYGCILTENLISLGYKNVDRHEGFDLKTSKSVLRDLATFHAIPWAIKQQKPDLFKQKILPFMPSFGGNGELGDPLVPIKENLRNMPEIEQYLDRVFDVLDKNPAYDSKNVPSEPWATIAHSDFWSNNIMVTDEAEPKTIILDLQGTTYGSLASDIIFLFALSIKLDVIKLHMDALIEHYWLNLIDNLKQLGSDTSALTYEGFLEELSVQAKKELGHAFFIGQFVLNEKGKTTFDSSDDKFKKEDLGSHHVTFSKLHRDRFGWVIQEFARRNWI